MSATLITDGSRRNAHGFTLIELIAVLVIIGIVSAVAVTILSSLDKYRLVSEVEILKTHLRYAQSRAMSDTVPWGIVISPGSYTLQKNGAPASILPNENSATHDLQGKGVTATASNVTFDIWGSSGGTTVILSAGGDSRTITVTANTGFIP